ncbi:uncharacterized protein LOC125315088 [Rhodamnia argentea]|uniref:Uncharacterized protein LOC125315088 n=1 Tax=Rhodamnia argentea TaxID=178133 RepID=A0ABM3HEM9_9MYRT|nr:uncharacterized protein LOC125315088 [Rhodamnia argentea]
MASEPSPLALLLQASELRRQRLQDYNRTHLIESAKSNSFEAERSTKVYNAQKAWERAERAYVTEACTVLEEGTLLVSSMEEMEALLELLRLGVTLHRPLSVVIKGPLPQGNVVDPLVAQMRATLEREGFESWHGNTYNFLQSFLPFLYPAPAEQPAPAAD